MIPVVFETKEPDLNGGKLTVGVLLSDLPTMGQEITIDGSNIHLYHTSLAVEEMLLENFISFPIKATLGAQRSDCKIVTFEAEIRASDGKLLTEKLAEFVKKN